MEQQSKELMESYFQTKDTLERNQILKQLLCDMPFDAKDFFLQVFKKERYLDMKLSAVRGYAAYATENEVCILMNKLLQLLKKRPDKTPYNYTEYEPMRSVFLMPYLLKRYNYLCFRIFNEQLERQYNDMPNCFKNIFTLDENGNIYNIRDLEEVRHSMDTFMNEKTNEL
ncbi:MAG: hypothetical protein E7629_02975 [Ruminococcaceae bacterium]|nr:hypothetical protein [Oscillospiraceae bacterium]